MKLCPICNSSIIPDSWLYCYRCEHKIDPVNSIWDGGFPSGAIGRAVAYNYVCLIVKNETAVCDNQKGLAVYDLENRAVGVLYRKIDDGCYKYWYGINYADCQKPNINDKPMEEMVQLERGTYDVEVVFFSNYRCVFGDNRKVLVGGVYENIEDFNSISENVSQKGSVKYVFYCLQVGHMNERLLTARRNYRKIPLGVFDINEEGKLSMYENDSDSNTHYLPELMHGGSTEHVEYGGYKLIRGIDVCRRQNDASERYCGEICYDLQLGRHVVLFSPKLTPIIDNLKQSIASRITLTNPVFLENSEYREISDDTIAKVKDKIAKNVCVD